MRGHPRIRRVDRVGEVCVLRSDATAIGSASAVGATKRSASSVGAGGGCPRSFFKFNPCPKMPLLSAGWVVEGEAQLTLSMALATEQTIKLDLDDAVEQKIGDV